MLVLPTLKIFDLLWFEIVSRASLAAGPRKHREKSALLFSTTLFIIEMNGYTIRNSVYILRNLLCNLIHFIMLMNVLICKLCMSKSASVRHNKVFLHICFIQNCNLFFH